MKVGCPRTAVSFLCVMIKLAHEGVQGNLKRGVAIVVHPYSQPCHDDFIHYASREAPAIFNVDSSIVIGEEKQTRLVTIRAKH